MGDSWSFDYRWLVFADSFDLKGYFPHLISGATYFYSILD